MSDDRRKIVLAGSGYDATQMRNTSGDLKSVKDQKGEYTVPKIKYPVKIVKEKQSQKRTPNETNKTKHGKKTKN